MGYPDAWPLFDDTVELEAAQQALTAAALSDGLPLIPPTTERLNAMLTGIDDPNRSFGHMPPLFGELTPAAIAYNCVLAGCQPGAVAPVSTAAQACLADTFNLLGLATTTGSPAIATVVHGPIAEQLAINGGPNCLGPGNPANATIGRAMSLVLRNIAGMRPGAGDMATMGQPGKYGFCFAEAPSSALPALHARRGIAAHESAVTVLGVSGTIEVLPSQMDGNWETPEAILDPVADVMSAAWMAGGGSHKGEPGEHVLLLPPELAALITTRGWDVTQIQTYVFERVVRLGGNDMAEGPDSITVIVTGGAGTKMAVLPLWGGGTKTITRRIISV